MFLFFFNDWLILNSERNMFLSNVAMADIWVMKTDKKWCKLLLNVPKQHIHLYIVLEPCFVDILYAIKQKLAVQYFSKNITATIMVIIAKFGYFWWRETSARYLDRTTGTPLISWMTLPLDLHWSRFETHIFKLFAMGAYCTSFLQKFITWEIFLPPKKDKRFQYEEGVCMYISIYHTRELSRL